MNAMTNFTLRSLRANRVRTLVTIAGVALAAALLTAVLTSYASLNDFLYRGEAQLSGTWMACVEAEGGASLEGDIAAAQDDPSVTGTATLRDVGFASLTEKQQSKQGTYVPLRSFEGDVEELCGIRPSEGRLPENPGEIMLFATWQSYEDVQIGDEITFDVGQRVARLAPGEEGEASEGAVPAADDDFDDEGTSVSIQDGTLLDSSIGVLDAASDGGTFNEEIVDAKPRTFTVVGFYDRSMQVLSKAAGMTALTVGEGAGEGTGEGTGEEADDAFTDVYLAFSSVANAQEVKERAQALFPDDDVVLHTAMLRYMGISDGSGLWSTFYGLVIVLAAVIVAACVSLIFNAFNISVAERIKQFGLLSSVGASRRQLRRAVVLEGALVALVGIPLGLLVGLGGCAVTFAFIGPVIASFWTNIDVPFSVAVNGGVLAAASALTLVTVLVSVWIPAKRASRTNIIESLRAAGGIRVSRRGAAAAMRNVDAARLWKARGWAGRVFGIGGTLSRINRKRGVGKGRAASVSLALAIVLLMTAGSLNVFLGTLAGVASGGMAPAGEIGIMAQIAPAGSEDEDGGEGAEGDAAGEAADGAASGAADAAGAPGGTDAAGAHGGTDATENAAAPMTPEMVAAADTARFAEEAATYQGAYERLAACPNAEARGWKLAAGASVILPDAMVGNAFTSEDGLVGGRMADGRFGTTGSLVYLDDAAFDAYAKGLGLDPADFHDPNRLAAIALAQGYGNNGDVYQLLDVLREPGTVELLAGGTYKGQAVDGWGNSWNAPIDGGAPTFAFVPYVMNGDGAAEWDLAMADVDVETVPLDIVALADEPSAVVGGPGAGLQLIVPMSMAATQSFGNTDPVFTSYFDAADGDHAALADELTTVGGAYFHDETPYELAFYTYSDYVEQRDSAQMMAMVVNVFCLLFTVILALIAMANVFNTVTNSLILRRREFAVMRSVGLSGRQFRRMIVDECMGFGIAGLVPGLLISAGVAFLLWKTVTQSMTGIAFTLPWGYVALAVGMTAAAMGISVAYGMHRCKADNVVEALRADSI